MRSASAYPSGNAVCIRSWGKENGRICVDKVHEYILDENGMSVRLILRVLTDYPSVSVKIDLERFLNTWNECKNVRNKRSAKAEAEKLAREIEKMFSDDDIDLHVEVKEQPKQLVKKPKKDNKGNN